MSIRAREEDIVSFIEGIKRQWVAMIDTIADPIVLIDKQGQVVKTNKAMAQMFKSQYGDIIGKKSDTLFASLNLPSPLNLVSKMEKERAQKNKVSISTADDLHYDVSIQDFIDENGEHEGYVLLYSDVTSSKRLQSQLVQSEKLASIGLLAGGIAHEINNPLGGILVFSQMILREMSPTDQHYSDVEEILNATERCKAIVENLLEFARQSPIKKSDKKERADLVDAIDTALRFVKLGINDRNIDIIWEKQIENAVVAADKNKIIQLFLNLLQNSAQAMPRGGEITLKLYHQTEDAGHFVICEVIDTGMGIPIKVQKKVFDPFFTTKDPGEGTGLGLAICYGIAEELGGKITLVSKENVGSTFKVKIPLIEKTELKTA